MYISGRSKNKDCCTRQPLISEDILEFFSTTAERDFTKLNRKQILNVFYYVCAFRVDRKTKMFNQRLGHFRFVLCNHWAEFNFTCTESICALRTDRKAIMAARPLIGLAIFDFLPLNRLTEFDETWLEASSQRLLQSKSLTNRSKNKIITRHLIGWHFRFSLYNRRTEFDETWQEANTQRPLPRLCFSGRLKNEKWITKMSTPASDWLYYIFYQVCVFWVDPAPQLLIGHRRMWRMVLRCTV